MNFEAVIREVPDPKFTLVLMHGLGSDERDMAGLAEMLDGRFEVICLRAPHQYGPGYAWFDIQWTLQGIEIDKEQYNASVDQVIDFLDSLSGRPLLVGGFSQGAMMSLGIIAKRLSIATGGLLLSGRGLDNQCPDFEGKVFHAHGVFDDVISISDARKLHESLMGLGDRYEYHEYEMGHWINDEELRDVNRWLAALL